MKIAELPFHERPVLELLNLAEFRERPDRDYAGYGWARVERLWLVDNDGRAHGDEVVADRGRAVDDVLLLALHTADDAPALADDLQLELELPGAAPVAVMASRFLATWVPMLPRAQAIVLAVCNPHRAALARPGAAPIYLPNGDVESWLDHANRDILLTADSWRQL